MGELAAQKRQRHQAILKPHAEAEEYQVAASLSRLVDRGHAIVYYVAHLVGRRGFDETLKSTAHGRTVVNNKESGPARAVMELAFGLELLYARMLPKFDGSGISIDPADNAAPYSSYVGAGVTLRLTDNPVQLENGTLSGGNWEVDDTGLLIIPSDITQITGGPKGAYYTVLSITSGGSLQDTSSDNPLATLTSVGSFTVLDVPSLTLHDLACQGSFNVGSLTVTGTFTLESGCSAGAGSLTVSGTLTVPSGATAAVSSLLSATSVLVESGGTLSEHVAEFIFALNTGLRLSSQYAATYEMSGMCWI